MKDNSHSGTLSDISISWILSLRCNPTGKTLPDEWDQSITHFLAIIIVAKQVPQQHFSIDGRTTGLYSFET
jgi:hypothetical protein